MSETQQQFDFDGTDALIADLSIRLDDAVAVAVKVCSVDQRAMIAARWSKIASAASDTERALRMLALVADALHYATGDVPWPFLEGFNREGLRTFTTYQSKGINQ